jgi:transcription termination factor NusB
VQVLYRILSIFEKEIDENGHVRKKKGKKRCYTLLVPMMESGLCSAARLGNSLNSQTIDDRGSDAEAREEGSNAEADQVEEVQWLDGLWNKVVVVLTQMLSPVRSQSHGPYISRAASLQETLEVVVLHVPPSQHDSIFPVLSSGASTSVEIARFQTAIMNSDSKTAETRRKAETRREEALKIFEACFNGMCSLEPKSPILHDLTKNVLQGALSPDSNAAALSDDYDLRTDVAVIVCQVIARNAEMERLVIAVFSLLCKLMSAENEFLRTEAGILLGRIDVGQVLETATRRCELAEERVQEAEEHIRELVDEIEDLREENDSLQQQILVYATSSALT